MSSHSAQLKAEVVTLQNPLTELEEVEAPAVDIAAEQRKAEKTEYKDLASPKGHNKVYDSKLNAFSRKQERAYF